MKACSMLHCLNVTSTFSYTVASDSLLSSEESEERECKRHKHRGKGWDHDKDNEETHKDVRSESQLCSVSYFFRFYYNYLILLNILLTSSHSVSLIINPLLVYL